MAAVPPFQSYLDDPKTVTAVNMADVYRDLAVVLNRHGTEETDSKHQALLRKIIELQMQGGGTVVHSGKTTAEVAAEVAAAAAAAAEEATAKAKAAGDKITAAEVAAAKAEAEAEAAAAAKLLEDALKPPDVEGLVGATGEVLEEFDP
jgi:hypothetical protein